MTLDEKNKYAVETNKNYLLTLKQLDSEAIGIIYIYFIYEKLYKLVISNLIIFVIRR